MIGFQPLDITDLCQGQITNHSGINWNESAHNQNTIAIYCTRKEHVALNGLPIGNIITELSTSKKDASHC